MSFHLQNWFGGMISASADEFFWQLWMMGRTLSRRAATVWDSDAGVSDPENHEPLSGGVE